MASALSILVGCYAGGRGDGSDPGPSSDTDDDTAGASGDNATADGGTSDSAGDEDSGPGGPGGPGGQPPPEGGVEGILDCPTVPLPAYGVASDASLSEPFALSCATCHGGAGQGLGNYPAIPGSLDEAAFIAKVRSGSGAMPAYGPEFVSDEQLAQDFAQLKALAGMAPGSADPNAGPATWTDQEVEEIYQAGLEAWRKPGSVDGQACTNCHSADGVELAIIGFSDDAILRRGQMHLGPEDALAVRDFIHAQRRRLGIAQTCSTDWRPFQPGGTVLPGETGAEQDAAFLEVLEERGLRLATGEIVTLDDAEQAFAELQSVDLRRLPIGIPLPRFTEDKFNGPEHRDVNDYMAPVPTAPNRPEEYFALEDAYLADPTDEALYALLEYNRTEMNDLGYEQEHSVPSNPQSNCGAYPTSTSWIMDRITRPKRQSVLVAAHLFREEIRRPGHFYDRPPSPFPDAPTAANPAFTLGGFAIEPPCYDDLTYSIWMDSFPHDFLDEMPQIDLERGQIVNTTDRLTHVWMTLGQILDPSLISTDDMQSNKIHYWATRNFEQPDVHLPFMYSHRIAVLTQYWEQVRGTPQYPAASGPFDHASRDWLHPLLADDNQQFIRGLESAVDPNRGDMPGVDVNRFKGNVIRMLLLLMRAQLEQGMAIEAGQNFDHCLGLICQVQLLDGYVDGLRDYASTPEGMNAFASQGFDLELYEADTRQLIQEVLGLLDAAPRRD